jgi:hypothetical protein
MSLDSLFFFFHALEHVLFFICIAHSPC